MSRSASPLAPLERAERKRFVRTALSLLGLCVVPIGLSFLPGVSIATLVAPFVALAGLLLVTAAARARHQLSPALAFAIVNWGAAAVLAAAGAAALEFSSVIEEPPEAIWLTKRTCSDTNSGWILLCPIALLLDLLIAFFLGIAYAAWAFGWALEHLGAPVLFIAAAVELLVGIAALRRARAAGRPGLSARAQGSGAARTPPGCDETPPRDE